MSTGRRSATAALVVAAGLGLAGCGGAAQGANTAPPEVASVAFRTEGAPGLVTLAETAVRRLHVETTAVTAGPGGLVVPYSAVVYEPDGSPWVYVQVEPGAYQRAGIAIGAVAGDQVTLTSGPPPGTLVVTQGAAELVGVETGIDGEE